MVARQVRFDREDEESPVGHVEAYVGGAYGGIHARIWNLTCCVTETIEEMYGIAIAGIEQEIGNVLLRAVPEDIASRCRGP